MLELLTFLCGCGWLFIILKSCIEYATIPRQSSVETKKAARFVLSAIFLGWSWFFFAIFFIGLAFVNIVFEAFQ